jgi:hypothetical protein
MPDLAGIAEFQALVPKENAAPNGPKSISVNSRQLRLEHFHSDCE